MKRTLIVTRWLCVCLACLTGQAWALDTGKLRRLLPTPAHILHDEMALSMGLGSVPTLGYGLYHDGTEGTRDLSEPLTRAQARLRRDPDDAQAAFGLGELLNAEGAHDLAQTAYARSVILFQQQVAARPDNPWLLTRLGVALERAGRRADAETALHRATAAPPAPWQAWLQRGNLLASARTQERIRQAEGYFDRAVEAAPREALPRFRRANFRRATAAVGKGGAGDFLPYPPQSVADIDTAIRLSRDPYFIASAASTEALYASFTRRGTIPRPVNDRIWDVLPGDTQQSVKGAMLRLRRLTRSTVRTQAAGAWMARAWLQYEILYQPAAAEDSLRRALARDPFCEPAADYLTHIYYCEDAENKAASFLGGWIRRRDTNRNRILLAVALADQGRIDPALAQMRVVRGREPQDFEAALACAVLCLREQPDNDLWNREAALALADAAKSLNAATSAGQRREYDLTLGLAFALNGQRAEAEHQLRRLSRPDGNDAAANEALALLGH